MALGPTPLDEIEDALLAKVTERFVGQALEHLHADRISAVTDRVWYRVRAGNRRGAVWIDDVGIPWLCASGIRKEGDSADFYQSFQQRCTSGSDVFLPTDADRKRLKLEQIHKADDDRLVLLRVRVAEALWTSISSGSPSRVSLPTALDPETLTPRDGALLLLQFTDGDDGTVGEITLSLEISDYATSKYLDILYEVREAIPGLPVDDWDNVPAMGGHQDPCWYALVDREWMDRVANAIATAGTATFAQTVPDLTDGPDGYAHVVSRSGLTHAVVEKVPVRGLCGRTFVPEQDTVDKPICPSCATHESVLESITR